MQKLFDARYGKNWMYAILRIVMLIVFSILLYLQKPITQISDFSTIQHILIPAIVGIVGLAVFAVVVLIKSIKAYAQFAVLFADLILVFAYIYFLPNDDFLLLLTIIPSVIAVSGILRLGSILSTFEATGTIIVAAVALSLDPEIGFEMIRANPSPYIPGVLVIALLSLLAAVWAYTLDEENEVNRIKVREEVEETRSRLSNMRERTAGIAELAARLNSTLNYERILDAALDIARISIRNEGKSRTVSLAVMIVDDETMEIADARGLQSSDMHHKFSGREGIMAEAMDEGSPIIKQGKLNDPELNVINAMANAKTTLCIPLRANFETYGVLVFATDEANAINEDHIDTLSAIGVQTTVALQNAVLYNNLREEKERIIRIEENGRKSLVRDLHDIPTQTVSAVAMHLSTLPTLMERYPERFPGEIENIRNMALRATEEIRHVMFTLRPLALETNGLTVALGQLADKMGKTYKQPMQVKIDPRVEEVLEKEAQGTLFYLIEEAANNSRKYAEATMIQVSGAVQNGEVIVRIRDNGRGFDTTAVNANYESRGSFGMVNMRERAELINASFELQSAPGKGTSVTVRVPIEDENLSKGVTIIKPRRALRKQYSGPISPSN
jgi:signal transduction histidine kinase